MTQGHNTVLVFAKAPIPGKVNTRLQPTLSQQQCAVLQQHFIQRSLTTACNLDHTNIELWCTPDTSHPFFSSCAAQFPIQLRQQHGLDLGERMHHALQQTLQTSDSAVLMGTDCPGIDTAYLTQAFTQLSEGDDLVLGPALDGGYVMIGARKTDWLLFKDIHWGSAKVLEQTRQRITTLQMRCTELEPLQDIDTQEDLDALRQDSEFKHLLQNLTGTC